MKNRRKHGNSLAWVQSRQIRRERPRKPVQIIDMPDDAVTNYVTSGAGVKAYTASGITLPKDSHVVSNTAL